MRLYAILALCTVTAFAATPEVEDGVNVLTDDNFDDFIKSSEYVLVEFYAPWCGHCKHLAPEYAKAAKRLVVEESPVKLAKVDATVHTTVSSKFGVSGYPTLKFFRNGESSDYTGGRTEDTIVSWLSKKTGPALTPLSSADETEAFKKKAKLVFVGYFKDMNSNHATFFTEYAAGSDLPFGIAHTAEALTEPVTGDEAVFIFKQFDEGKAMFEGEFTKAAFDEFIRANRLPYAIEFSEESAQYIFGGPNKVHFLLFLKETSSDESKKLIDELSKTAKQLKGKLLFVYLDSGSSDAARVIQFFSIKESEMPTVRLVELADKSVDKYLMSSKTLDSASFSEFAQSFLDGKLKKFLMSEEPVEYSGKGVRVLTGKDHDSIARDKAKNVFVEYYAPWCGHCKKLAPVWEDLAKEFEGTDSIVIAKMDATANEVEGVPVQGFPTLKFYPADSDEVIDYDDSERTLDALKSFLAKNAEGIELPVSDGPVDGEVVDDGHEEL